MEILRFPTLDEAERHLRRDGFRFQGAPNRWRKAGGTWMGYANAWVRNNGAVVIITYAEAGRSRRAG